MKNEKYLASFMQELGLSDAAKQAVYEVQSAVLADEDATRVCEEIKFRLFDASIEAASIVDELKAVAERLSLCENTLALFVLCSATDRLKEKYRAKGISEQIIHDTLYDFAVKCEECYELIGKYGLYSIPWAIGFFRNERYAFGRLQIELSKLSHEQIEICGKTYRKGDTVLAIHIPRSEKPFDDEARLSSYKMAYEHFKGCFHDAQIPYTCSSWLLYPYNKEILSERSNVNRFANEFKLMSTGTGDLWIRFIFGMIYTGDPEELPEKSSLHRAYKKLYREGGVAGSGYGIFLFDGESITKE